MGSSNSATGPIGSRRRGRLASRSGVRAAATLLDEALSSLQNFVVLFASLHYLSVRDIGSFTLAYSGALLVESVLKTWLLEPLMIRFSVSPSATQRRATAEAAGAALVLSVLSGVVIAAGSLLFSSPVRELILACAALTPCLVTQEAWRVHFFATARPWRAVANDGMCLVVTMALVGALAVGLQGATQTELLLVWAAGTGVGAVAGMVQTRILPAVGRALSWTRSHWTLGTRLASGFGAEQLAGRVSLAVIGAVSGTAALGLFSAARTIVSPVTTLVTSAISFAVPEAARLRQRRDPRMPLFIGAVSAVLATSATLFGVAMYILPDRLGRLLAGQNWDTAKTLLAPMVCWTAVVALRHGPRVGLRVLERSRSIVRLSVWTGVGVIAGTTIGCLAGGAPGAAWALVVVHLLMSAAWWGVYLRAMRNFLRAPSVLGE